MAANWETELTERLPRRWRRAEAAGKCAMAGFRDGPEARAPGADIPSTIVMKLRL